MGGTPSTFSDSQINAINAFASSYAHLDIAVTFCDGDNNNQVKTECLALLESKRYILNNCLVEASPNKQRKVYERYNEIIAKYNELLAEDDKLSTDYAHVYMKTLL